MPICLTTDIEWASESHIKALFDLADQFGVPLFPFVTHDSAFLRARGGAQGIHPNFLRGSTQGQTEIEVLDHCFRLVPEAKAFRSHCFYDHTRLVWTMAERGVVLDSNVLRYMDDPRAYQSIGGYMRYPVYWSDDVAKRRGETRIDRRRFQSSEVLVCNVHPLNADTPMVRQLVEFARGKCVPFESLYCG